MSAPEGAIELGSLRLHRLRRVVALDGPGFGPTPPQGRREANVVRIEADEIRSIFATMAVVVPCRDEPAEMVAGVIEALPPEVTTILVSNADDELFDQQADQVRAVGRNANRSQLVVHQRSPLLAEAFARAGFTSLLDRENMIRDGKGEGMLVGIALARILGAERIGFIDADNHLPASVREYATAFAAGFHLSQAPHCMVRIKWRSKPKLIGNSFVVRRTGRVSRTTNRFLDRLVRQLSGGPAETIHTGNAGEHAMTMDLALELSLSGGFSIEPRQVLELIHRFGHTADPGREVDLFQIETLHPHIHLERGGAHVETMRRVSLATMFHHPVTPASIREMLQREAGAHTLPPPPTYPPLASLDWEAFEEAMSQIEDIQPLGPPPRDQERR